MSRANDPDDTDIIHIERDVCPEHSGMRVAIKDIREDIKSMWIEINGIKKLHLTVLGFVVVQCLVVIGALLRG